MHAAELQRLKELEATRRRGGATHPDACPKLNLGGVPFGIPPRQEGWITFRFDSGGAHVQPVQGETWPEARAVVDGAAVGEKTCRTCGRPVGATLTVEARRDAVFLGRCATLAARLLVRQYELSDQEIAGLLRFDPGRLPEWIPQIVQWAHTGHTDLPAEGAEIAFPRRPARAKRWWQFWRSP